MKKPLVVYHGPTCLDGLGAAAAFYAAFQDDVEYAVGRYQSGDSIDYSDRHVYFVDFCIPPAEMLEVAKLNNHIVVLDHHASTLNAYANVILPSNVNMSHCTNDHSGAWLAWSYVLEAFKDRISRYITGIPEIVKLIQDRDLWKFEYAETRAVTTALYAKGLNIEELYATIAYEGIDELQQIGEILLTAHDKDCQDAIRHGRRTMVLTGTDLVCAAVVNAAPKLSSDIGNILAKEAPFAMTYTDTPNHREFSLRSSADNPEALDVQAIALLFGGGGHKHAAGFKVKRDHPLAQA